MHELWARAFQEFEKLSAMSAPVADAHLLVLHRTQPELAILVEQLRSQPDISLQPILWTEDAIVEQVAVGHRLGAYTLIREIGRGGMGSVWLGERADGLYQGRVAIKLLSTSALRAPTARERFTREGELLARLSHPNIARLLDAGLTEAAVPYLVLEYVDGLTLQKYCEVHAAGIDATIDLFCHVLDAVAYAHSMLVLHRDIKPGNILVNAAAEVKLLDFGLGKLLDESTESGTGDLTRVAGVGYTLRYAPPEQIRGLAVSTASDVYSLGITLYELLTGQPLDTGQHYTRPSEKLTNSPTRSNWSKRIKGDIDSIIAKAISESPEDRYANAAAMKEDLNRFLNHEPVKAQPDTNLYRTGKFVRRHKFAVGASAFTLLTIIAALALSVLQTIEANRQRERAQTEAEARDKATDYVIQLLSNFAPRDKPLTTTELLDIGVAKISTVFKDDYRNSVQIAQLLAERFSVMGEKERAVHAQRAALSYAHKSGDSALIVDATSLLAEILARRGEMTEASALLAQAAAMLPQIARNNPRRDEIEENLLADQISVAGLAGDAATAVSAAERLLALRRKTTDTKTSAQAVVWNRVAFAYNGAMRFTDSLAAQDHVASIRIATGERGNASALVDYSVRLYTLQMAADPGAAVAYIVDTIRPDISVALHELPVDLFARIAVAYASYGDIERAQQLIAARSATFDTTEGARLHRSYARFNVCLLARDVSCVRDTEADAVAFFLRAHPHNPARNAARHWVMAASAELSAESSRARAAINAGLAEIGQHVNAPSPFLVPLLLVRARLDRDQGDSDAVRRTVREGLDYLARHHQYESTRCLWRAELLQLDASAAERLGLADTGKALRSEAQIIFRNVLVLREATQRTR